MAGRGPVESHRPKEGWGWGTGKYLHFHRLQAASLDPEVPPGPSFRVLGCGRGTGRGGDSDLVTRRSAVGKDFHVDRNHFPLLSRQVSEWLRDLPQAHSWERGDDRAASTWGCISFRAAVQSPPTLHPHPWLRFGSRKTDQHVNREWGVPGNPAPRARQRPQADVSVPRLGGRERRTGRGPKDPTSRPRRPASPRGPRRRPSDALSAGASHSGDSLGLGVKPATTFHPTPSGRHFPLIPHLDPSPPSLCPRRQVQKPPRRRRTRSRRRLPGRPPWPEGPGLAPSSPAWPAARRRRPSILSSRSLCIIITVGGPARG
ncbi:uncharacterized protein LOC144233640 [Crocuta crocuta]